MQLFIPEAHRHAAGERCACGHPRSAHDDRWAVTGGLMLDVPGHGACDAPGCRCRRFRWAAWIFARPARKRPDRHSAAAWPARVPVNGSPTLATK
jgi:hypothetical protein